MIILYTNHINSTTEYKYRRLKSLLLNLPQDYVAELHLKQGLRGRGLSHESITHPYHVLLSGCKGTTIK